MLCTPLLSPEVTVTRLGRHRGLQNTARRTVRDRDGEVSEEETTDTGDELVAVGRGSRPEGKERGRERERVCMYSNESRAMEKSQRSREDKRGDASIRVTGKTD